MDGCSLELNFLLAWVYFLNRHPCILDDITFHPIVNLSTYKSAKMITFLPPNNTLFQLMRSAHKASPFRFIDKVPNHHLYPFRFRSTKHIVSPITVTSLMHPISDTKFQLELKIHCALPPVAMVNGAVLSVQFCLNDEPQILETKPIGGGKMHWESPNLQWRYGIWTCLAFNFTEFLISDSNHCEADIKAKLRSLFRLVLANLNR